MVSAVDGFLTQLYESRTANLVATDFCSQMPASFPVTAHLACGMLLLLDRVVNELAFLLLFLDRYLEISVYVPDKAHILRYMLSTFYYSKGRRFWMFNFSAYYLILK